MKYRAEQRAPGGDRMVAHTELSRRTRDEFVEVWLQHLEQALPGQTGLQPAARRDPFRDPVGSTLRTAVRVLAHELAGGFDRARVRLALDAIVHLRAVQDVTSEVVVGMIGLSRAAARVAAPVGDAHPDSRGWLERFGARVEELERLAAGLFDRCRADIRDIADRADHRRTFVIDRARARPGTRRTMPLLTAPEVGGNLTSCASSTRVSPDAKGGCAPTTTRGDEIP